MAIYKVQVSTGQDSLAGTFDTISITLVGSYGESPKHVLDRCGFDFQPGSVREYKVPSEQALGPILLIRLHKEPYSFFPENMWYCNTVRVTSPEGDTYYFPCYRWIQGYRTVELAESTAQTPCDDSHYLLQKHRREELVLQQERYRWKEYSPGAPWCADIDSAMTAEVDLQYSYPKASAFFGRGSAALLECKIKGFLDRPYSWEKLADIPKVFWFYRNPVSEYVFEHWQEDAFFGYQYLNGFNPVLIQKCTALPENFPVTREMVAGFLGESTSLQEELQRGSIYIADYKLLEDIPTTKVNGHQQYIAAPLCLLHQKPSGEVVPLAIQLSQHPGPESPIFLPSDSEWLWTLAKTWVRNSEFHLHEVTSHLLRAHLLAEVFAVATQRQLPMCHPLYKLLIPHIRFSIHIDVLARTFLISPGGVFDRAIATGRRGLAELLRKALENLTYTTLCFPDDIQERGVASLQNYYYRDDGLKIWAAIESFVSGIVTIYYQTSLSVQSDHELQAWVGEIFAKGFLGRQASGIPSALGTTAELTKYLTMVIFTCSAYHAAVNAGQFELAAFMPNYPSSMRKPPPRNKAKVTLKQFLDTIPEMNTTSLILSVLWVLRNEDRDMRPLGTYPEEHFTEHGPKQLMAAFQDRLAEISREIKERNQSLSLSYNYMYPPNIENSTAI
ncbi:hydroperoxide isomerase ALOXE3-like [Trachemys scripta elegans]|uniref:hydroperoxide isomerase ALOXE3-like n=1 Tax=Trachemys scripta elegans TaxID=31138 RepID=UPI001551EB1B|nr:hydroperoxide isomerase ALOXE3-like [Trachemys scripta elegans]